VEGAGTSGRRHRCLVLDRAALTGGGGRYLGQETRSLCGAEGLRGHWGRYLGEETGRVAMAGLGLYVKPGVDASYNTIEKVGLYIYIYTYFGGDIS
jgi:hypothetical protein